MDSDHGDNRPGGATVPRWAELLEAYRGEPGERWSGQLLERLRPWLLAARRQIYAVPPHYDREDLSQELVLEVLRIARRWRPICAEEWIPRRLVERAARRVIKKLLAARLDTVELDPLLESTHRAEPELVIDTPLGKASAADLTVIYRAAVVGESIEVLAEEAGLTPKPVLRRLKSARQRVRLAASREEA